MRSVVERSLSLVNSFLHEDVLSLRGSRKFQVRGFLSLSFEWFGSIKDYNAKASKEVTNPSEALVSASSGYLLS